jgi:hypothetical protein
MFYSCNNILLGIGLQKQYCATENKIPKSRNQLYEVGVDNQLQLRLFGHNRNRGTRLFPFQ